MGDQGSKRYNFLPGAFKSELENQCRKIVRKASGAVPGEKNEKKATEMLNKAVCNEVKNIDKIVLKKLAEELAKIGKKHSAKAPKGTPPHIKAVGKLKAPHAGIPSLNIPITKFIINKKLGTTGKLDLKVWADPRDFDKKSRGVMLNFTVVKW